MALLALLLVAAGTAAFLYLQLPSEPEIDLRQALGNVTLGDQVRPYLFHLPPQATESSEPLPLVLVLHGAGGSARQIQGVTGLDEVADAEGFIAVYPNAAYPPGMVEHAWNAGFCCDVAKQTNQDDLGYLEAILDQFGAALNIDANRIHVIGFSSGGMMAHWFAAHHSDRVASIATAGAAVAGADWEGEPMLWIPPPTSRVSVLMLHGDHDKIVPFAGGTTSRPTGEAFPSFMEGVERWAQYNNLTEYQEYEEPVDTVTWRVYADGSGVEVVGAAVHGAGHGISNDLPVGQWLLDFVRQHPRPN